MKRVFLLSLLLAFSLCACSKQPQQPPAPTVQQLSSPLTLSAEEDSLVLCCAVNKTALCWPSGIATARWKAPFIIPIICFAGIIRTGPRIKFPSSPKPTSPPQFLMDLTFYIWTMNLRMRASPGRSSDTRKREKPPLPSGRPIPMTVFRLFLLWISSRCICWRMIPAYRCSELMAARFPLC